MPSLDLAPFFDADTGFAQSAVLDGRDITAIFDHEYREVFFGEAPVAGRSYVAHVPSSDLGAAAPGSVLVIEGATYVVRTVEPHITGSTALRLEKQ